MSRIFPFLWFDRQAEEAVNFYLSVFEDSKIISTQRYDESSAKAAHMEPGSVLTLGFEIAGQSFTALNGGPAFKLNPSISFHIRCETVEEVDRYYEKLEDGGLVRMPLEKYHFSERFAWVEDRYGVSWQIIHAGDTMSTDQKIVPCLLFVGDQFGKTEQAVKQFISIFDNSSLEYIDKATEADPNPIGSVRYASFKLDGYEMVAMESDAKHDFAFNEAVSFVVSCNDQAEVDYYWDKLSEGGQESMCAWLKDRYGISWQVVPKRLHELLGDPDKIKAGRAMQAMLQMRKIIIADLEKAAEGE
ncbi:VOC family protein [bacterium]|nr:VOC family protein [bacterium]